MPLTSLMKSKESPFISLYSSYTKPITYRIEPPSYPTTKSRGSRISSRIPIIFCRSLKIRVDLEFPS